jgi:1-acyl-sn-glycerol-3-phosphate acyltransferase
MWTSLRAFVRTFLIVGWTLICYGTVVASRVLPARPRLALRNRAFQAWGRWLCRFLGARVEVEGEPPRGQFFMVSNHSSYVDIFLIASRVAGTFVAKSELSGWPAMGAVIRGSDTIFIDRSRKRDLQRVIDVVGAVFDRGLGIIVFPEGTSTKGDELERFKPSLLEFACNRDIPVYYATLSYETPPGQLPATQSVCWWGDEEFFPHFKRLIMLPQFRAKLRFGPAPIHHADRKELAESLWQAMNAQFEPMA